MSHIRSPPEECCFDTTILTEGFEYGSPYFWEYSIFTQLYGLNSEEELRVKEGFYNFKFSTYEFEVIAIGTAGADGNPVKYRFGLRGLIPQVVSNGIYDDRLDVALMERLGLEAAEEIKALLEPKVASLREVDVYLEVPGGLLPEDTAWRKGLPVAEEMRIGLTLDAEGLTVQDVSEMVR